MQNKKFDWVTKLEEIPTRVYVILALFTLALDTVLVGFLHLDPIACGTVSIVLYGVVSIVVYAMVHKKLNLFRIEEKSSQEQSQSVIYAFRNQLKIPYAVVSENGKIITINNAFSAAVGVSESLFNFDINTLCHIDVGELIEFTNKPRLDELEEGSPYDETPLKNVRKVKIAQMNGRKFHMECCPLISKDKTYYMIVFHDITELDALSTLHKNQLTAIGYIGIDNIEEIAQYVKVNYQDETRKVGKILGKWASDMGGTLCEYADNKFLLIFTQEMLAECVKNKFGILSEVHKIEIGDAHIPLTVSMGIATTGETLEDREHDAMVSLDMALQRGGDQVVLKSPTGIFYFGAKTKTLQKRTRGHGKIIYAKLAALIEESSNVIIMGHKNPDFDSIGACIGMNTLIRNMFPDKSVKIVIDKHSDNFKACTQRLSALADYKDMFIDRESVIEHNSAQTLVIVVDANNLSIVEAPELAKNAFTMAIIDHHIKKEAFEFEPKLSYIDPSASSACELISEILEEILPADASFKEEANIMMSGIMLDTKNFTRTVGMRTFAAALYLKNAGADTEYARTFFEEAFEDYLCEAQFGSQAKIYRDCIAIASSVDVGATNSRVAAAKASDKLLSIKYVDAAFALVLVGETVFISARSNGSINVQLIAEQLGGGGHFDMAGAAINNSSLEEAEALLKQAIDSYFENLSKENENNL